MKIIMLGAPGAGKGTQAKQIAAKYSIPHISTGDIFRANIKNNTELGQKAKTYMDKGELVPDELVVDLIMDRFKEADCANGYVLDGFPRTIPQAEALDKALSANGESVDYAVNVEVPDEKAPEKLSPAEMEGVKEKEGERILAKIKDKEYVYALAIEGKERSSEEFAKELEDLGTYGTSDITFVIGGSLGLSPEVLKRANTKISFGRFTLPHQLMRMVLAEQIYRGFMINAGRPYHK